MSPASRAGLLGFASFLVATGTFALAVYTNISAWRPALILTGLCFIVALSLGIWARIELARAVGRAAEARRAPVGILAAVFSVLPVFVGAAESVRWATVRIQGFNNLKQIGHAIQAYRDEHGHYPPAALRDKGGRPLLSWRVLLLPYLEDRQLYEQFHRDEAWDGPHNKRLLERMPRTYAALPGNPTGEPDTTFYQVFVGKGTVWGGEPLTPERLDAAHGRANTILIVEAGASVPWTKPADLPYAADRPLPPLGDFYKKEDYVNPRGRFLALFADGSVRCFFHDTPEPLLRPLVTWDGHEGVDWDALAPWCPDVR
jgi:hypothetical protein